MPHPSHQRALSAIQTLFGPRAEFRREPSGFFAGRYFGAYITSAFQPWRDVDGRVLAVEAYARLNSKAGEGLSPWHLFVDDAGANDLVALDRLSRTVHTLNHFVAAQGKSPLVLNVDARLLAAVRGGQGEFFRGVLDVLRLSPEHFVIDIRTTQSFDLTRLRDVLADYRRHGFAVALNVEGALHARALANFLAPDVLMLDALHLSTPGLARHVSSLADCGVKLAVKRIEMAAQFAAAQRVGADWVQGHYLDTPATTIAPYPADLVPSTEAA